MSGFIDGVAVVHKWTVGKDPACDVVVDDEYVSGRHCLVMQLEDGRFFVVDMGSTNGTWLNQGAGFGKVTLPAEIHPGMTLRVGRSEIPWAKS